MTGKEDDHRDVVIPGLGDLQIVKALSHPYANLSRAGTHEIHTDKASLDTLLLQTITKKAAMYPSSVKSSLILLLDGGLPVVPYSFIRSFAERAQQKLAESGFRELWFVSTPEDSAWRLFPHADVGTPRERVFAGTPTSTFHRTTYKLIQLAFELSQCGKSWKIVAHTFNMTSTNSSFCARGPQALVDQPEMLTEEIPFIDR